MRTTESLNPRLDYRYIELLATAQRLRLLGTRRLDRLALRSARRVRHNRTVRLVLPGALLKGAVLAGKITQLAFEFPATLV